MQELLPSMPSHFSKELFFIKHKVTGCWKRNNVTVNLSTQRPAAWPKRHALIPLCCVCKEQMLFANKEERVQNPSTRRMNVILQVISASGNTTVLETNIFLSKLHCHCWTVHFIHSFICMINLVLYLNASA